jgi:hypothetical protein
MEARLDAEFDQLYSQLRLTPACSLDELHRAFRRAVSELHPDRGGDPTDAEAQSRLRELIRLHARATEFHRRHGRLPGANPGLRPGPLFATGRAASRSPRQSAMRRWLIFLPLLGFVAWQLANAPY